MRRTFVRLVVPVFWVVTVPASIIRIPFLVLRGAGLPRSVEESVWARLVKMAELIAMLYVAGRFGVSVTPD